MAGGVEIYAFWRDFDYDAPEADERQVKLRRDLWCLWVARMGREVICWDALSTERRVA